MSEIVFVIGIGFGWILAKIHEKMRWIEKYIHRKELDIGEE